MIDKRISRLSSVSFSTWLNIIMMICWVFVSYYFVYLGFVVNDGQIGLLLAFFVFLVSVAICYRQEFVAFDVSLCESHFEDDRIQREKKIVYFERSIDLFYLPLLNLLTSCDGGVVDLVKLNEVNCHRYLAKPLVLSQFDDFYAECVGTGCLPVDMSGVLLITVNADIVFLNGELVKVSRDFLN